MEVHILVRVVSTIVIHWFHSGQVVVLWACEHSPPSESRWPAAPDGKSFVLLKDHELKMTNRLKPFDEIKYDAILSLDNDVTLHQEEIDFSFSVWQAFPHRIVGFPSRVICTWFEFLLITNFSDISIMKECPSMRTLRSLATSTPWCSPAQHLFIFITIGYFLPYRRLQLQKSTNMPTVRTFWSILWYHM